MIEGEGRHKLLWCDRVINPSSPYCWHRVDKVHIWFDKSVWGGFEIFWGDAKEFSKLPQKNVILLIVVCIVATFPTKVHTTQFAAKCCHLSTLLLHKMPLALLAETARFHVDIFMACFNGSYKIWLRPTPSLSWWKLTNQPTCHFFSEVKVGKSPFDVGHMDFCCHKMKALQVLHSQRTTSNTSMTSLQSSQHHSAYASDRDDPLHSYTCCI